MFICVCVGYLFERYSALEARAADFAEQVRKTR